jgi:hypothetical protein
MNTETVGQAKTVIVFLSGSKAQAVVTSVVATARPTGSAERIRFAGVVAVDGKTQRHILDDVLPRVDQMLTALGQPIQDYDLAFVNLGCASVTGIPLLIQGFSADLSVFLALFSAGSGVPVAQDRVFSGHIASPHLEVRMVGHLWEKMEAAAADPSITTFVCPSLEGDKSLNTLSPREKEHAEEAVIRWNEHGKVCHVLDVGELFTVAFSEGSIVLSGLERGFFEVRIPSGSIESPADRAVEYFVRDNEGRFWVAVEGSFFPGDVSRVRELLHARLHFHIQRESYPKDFGLRLLQLVATLPPYLRTRRGLFPLLPIRECILLTQFALDSDLEDFQRLLDAIRGKGMSRSKPQVPLQVQSQGDPADALLNDILSRIEARALSDEVGQRIDAARATFLLENVTVNSDEEFHEIVTSFYIHLLRTCGVVMEVNPEAVADDAYALLSRAFSRQGGPQAALAAGRCGIHGGMRQVLDVLTETLRREEEAKRTDRILQESLLGSDKWGERVGVAAALLRRFGPDLPPEIASKTPEQCAHHIQDLIRVSVASMEQVKCLLRSL